MVVMMVDRFNGQRSMGGYWEGLSVLLNTLLDGSCGVRGEVKPDHHHSTHNSLAHGAGGQGRAGLLSVHQTVRGLKTVPHLPHAGCGETYSGGYNLRLQTLRYLLAATTTITVAISTATTIILTTMSTITINTAMCSD